MEPLWTAVLIVVLTSLILVLTWLKKRSEYGAGKSQTEGSDPSAVGRLQSASADTLSEDRELQLSDEENLDADDHDKKKAGDMKKIGKKKMEKLQMKEEKRRAREQMLQEREEEKLRTADLEAELAAIREREEHQSQLEHEAKQREVAERERREHEAYLELKKSFQVNEEGFDEENSRVPSGDNVTGLDREITLTAFIEHIQRQKIVQLDELASEFNLRTADCIDRVKSLADAGRLTGVFDDCGKFIFISMAELEAIATHIQRQGRISIACLAETSNQLVNLTKCATE